MPKFTFICEHEDPNKFEFPVCRNTVDFTANTWPDIVREMTNFLRGCGYQFSGNLRVVDESATKSAFQQDVQEHSKYFYDFDRNR